MFKLTNLVSLILKKDIVAGMRRNPLLFVSLSVFLMLVVTYPILPHEGHFLRQEDSRFQKPLLQAIGFLKKDFIYLFLE